MQSAYYTVHHKGLLLIRSCNILLMFTKHYGTHNQQVVNPEGLYLCAQDISNWYSHKVATLEVITPLIDIIQYNIPLYLLGTTPDVRIFITAYLSCLDESKDITIKTATVVHDPWTLMAYSFICALNVGY